ncbi:acyl carrier protein [Mesorhizobium sp. M0292]|uniref:acyl carrier protein n=1 Tax=Mesorhizobium sp. M0292 TaxID=2956929 RepID=UPI00333C80DE
MGLAETVQDNIADVLFNLSPAMVKPTALLTALELDSLQKTELAMKLEEAFSIRVDDEALYACETVQDVIDLVEQSANHTP